MKKKIANNPSGTLLTQVADDQKGRIGHTTVPQTPATVRTSRQVVRFFAMRIPSTLKSSKLTNIE
jgi:hypothetical protein